MVVIDLSNVKCHWCGGLGTFKCTCGYRTCSDCHLFPTKDGCLHKPYAPIISDGWIIVDETATEKCK